MPAPTGLGGLMWERTWARTVLAITVGNVTGLSHRFVMLLSQKTT